jgi:hypothetical protein
MKIKLLVAASFFIPAMAMAEAPPLKAVPLVVAKPAVEALKPTAPEKANHQSDPPQISERKQTQKPAPKGDYSSAGKPPNPKMTCGPKKDGECTGNPLNPGT